jgi:hypothetical protein
MNIYRVIITTHSANCISVLSRVPGWKQTGDSTFETVQAAHNEGVAMRRAWSTFSYRDKARKYCEKPNTEAIHAELFEKIRKARRSSKVPPVHCPIPVADAANRLSAERLNLRVQAIEPSVSALRINRELRLRFEQEYEEKFKQWQKKRERS